MLATVEPALNRMGCRIAIALKGEPFKLEILSENINKLYIIKLLLLKIERTMSSKPNQQRTVYQEFGSFNQAVLKRAVPDLPPDQQDLRIQASRKGRKGKTVTVITGFQSQPETLTKLLKQLKTQCGSGGTVKENALEIQGAHAQKLKQILSQLGYKTKISGS